jgi:F0F1-type ATP synthase epsilon subunit
MNTFNLLIIAYDDVLFDGEAIHCGVTTLAGAMGLEARHEPLLAVLREDSDITYKDTSGEEKSVHVESGHLVFKENRCTITVDTDTRTSSLR